jgi:carbamoyltransferase
MPTYVLGTHLSHNGSACLLKDGRVCVAIEKERLTRIKGDGGADNEAIRYCLDAEGIDIRDVALVVQNANFDMLERSSSQLSRSERLVTKASHVVTISHHLAHAYSAIGTAPFREMAVLVIDGCGNCFSDCIDRDGATVPEIPPTRELEQLYFEKDSYYAFNNGRCQSVYKDFSPWAPRQPYWMYPSTTMHSIGGAYAGVSHYVFKGLSDPGKLMGLAPYGRPDVYPFEMFSLREGRTFLNYDWMQHFDRPARNTDEFKKSFQYYADIAWWTQREIERALLYLVNHRYEQHASDNLGYAGGVALNAVANRLIRTQTKFKDVYIQPAAGDNGLSIGAAFYGWLEVLGGKRMPHGGSSQFGRHYTEEEIETCLRQNEDGLEFEHREDATDAAVELLAAGKVIGWFQGRSEFGPRALGARSILALPVREELKDFINSKIKFREDFRPFAPSVLAEDASVYFEQDYDSPYMILVSPTRPEWRRKICAVVHQDGSARVQTVHKHTSPGYHALLEGVKRKTGLSVLLNTSLNRRGMPIAERPQDAVTLLLETALDALVIGSWVARKRARPVESLVACRPEDVFGSILASPSAREAVRHIGLLQFIVTGVEEAWTLRAHDSGLQVERGRARYPDRTVVVSQQTLSRMVNTPESVRTLYLDGQIEAPGLGPEQHGAILAMEDVLVALMRAARTEGH